MKIQGILFVTLSFALVNGISARKSRRHKKAAATNHEDTQEAVSLELIQENESPGVTRVNENTWKFRSKSSPVKTSYVTTKKATEEIASSGDVAISFEVRVGSKRRSSIFHAYSNATGEPTTWLGIKLDARENRLTTQLMTASLELEELDFILPDTIYRTWMKIFLVMNSSTTRVSCRIGCSAVQSHRIGNEINVALPRDSIFEVGGNSLTKNLQFSGQLRKLRIYTPAINNQPWQCETDMTTVTAGTSRNAKIELQADQAIPNRDSNASLQRVLEELRAEIRECREDNKRMENMMEMMKEQQASLQERIVQLESCECIPVCITEDGVKKRNGDSWTSANCTTCQCTNGKSACRRSDECATDRPCASNPCSNGGLCEERGETYSCRCRGGFYGDRCEFIDQCIRGICVNGGNCERLERGSYRCRCREGFTGRNCERQPLNHCSSEPCLNSAECTNTATSYICNCNDGFKGRRCQDRDDCFSNPCLNRGACTSLPFGGFTCRCQPGYFGTNCEIRDGCYSSPCMNGGKCQRGLHSYQYTCECPESYEGTRCERRNPCYSNPCLNGGRCIPADSDGSTYTCECLPELCGSRCQARSPCSPNPCLNGGSCVLDSHDLTNYSCVCLDGFHGPLCRDTSPCKVNPCLNGGRCVQDSRSGRKYICDCLEGFTGNTCENRDYCYTDPCQNDGRCENVPSATTGLQFTCSCVEPFIGPRCEMRDSCYSSPCYNGGQCLPSSTTDSDGNLRYTCRCTESYVGERCERQSLCASSPCLNGGVCENSDDGGFRCRCRATHYGELCELVDYCRAKPCYNEASCINKPSKYGQSYTCNCVGAYMGPNCQDLDLCLRKPCLNGGNCSMEDGHYVCACPSLYSGRRCEKMDLCAENLCLNGGRCENEDSGSGFRCVCPDTHTGNRCQSRHPCRPNPCLNNGRCRVISRGGFACECPPSRTGPRCRLVDHCYRNPCQNGGTCINNRDGFHCDCRDSFTGETCEESDLCASSPCMNGGTCVEENGRYKCRCPATHYGNRCQNELNICAYDKKRGQCYTDAQGPVIRWYFDKYTQRCQQFSYSGCNGNGNNFATRQACRQRCQSGACCSIIQSESGASSYECRTLAIGQCKRVDTQNNEVQVVAFATGVTCENYECGKRSTCEIGGQTYLDNTRLKTVCNNSCICRHGNIQCRCETKSLRREIRRLTTEERESFQNAIRMLKMTETKQGQNVWDSMRDKYMRSIPIAQSSRYFLLWNRAFLRMMEMELQRIDCDVTLPFYDFTQDAGRFNESVMWQPNYFGGDGDCVPDHPFRNIDDGDSHPWSPCISRKFNPSIHIPSMLDIASALGSRSYEQLSSKLQTIVNYVNAFIGGDMSTATRAYDPIFYPIHAFIDQIFMQWQVKHPGTSHLSYVKILDDIPLGIRMMDAWDGACVRYADWNSTITCHRIGSSPERFAPDGYNLQGYDRQGFDRDGYDKDGYNALGRNRHGYVDNRQLYKYDGFDAEGYARTGYDRRGFNRFGFNENGRNRDGIDAQGFDEAGFNRYGLDENGFDRRGYNLYGVNQYGQMDNEGNFDDETGYNDCCFGRDGLTAVGYDRYGFNVEGYDETSCSYFFHGPHTLYFQRKLWTMLAPQRPAFLSSIGRTCGDLDTLPRSQVSLNWPSTLSYPSSSRSAVMNGTGGTDTEKRNHILTDRYCFDVDMFLTWCPCLHNNYPAICTTNPCANAHCSLHPTARCVIDMCGTSCKAEYILHGRRVNCENPCEPNPCQNGGTCQPARYSSSSESFTCVCTDEFVGTLCDRSAPDTCVLPKRVGHCEASVSRWFYNFQTSQCEEFRYSGCGGNTNNFASKKICDLRCSTGACCYRLPKNSTFLVGFDRDGFDKYGFSALGFNRRGHQQSSHDSMPTGNRILPPKGLGHDGFDIYGYDKYGYDRQGYNRRGFHKDTGFNRTGYNPLGEYDQLRGFSKTGYDHNGRDRAGYTCSGIDREGFNQLGLYYDFEYHCESLHLTECEALKDPSQLGVPFEVISFTPGSTCDEVQCGEDCGCKVDDKIYRFGQKFEQGCETCTCTLGGLVTCECIRMGRRREIRDLTDEERAEYAAAIMKMYRSNEWEYATQHAQYMPKANGVTSSLPWHRYLLRKVEIAIQEHSNCEVFIPYFDWTIDVGKLDQSQVWQASYFGGDGDEENNCVNYHPFMQGDVRWHPCIKRKFNKSISLPDMVNFQMLLQEPDYENFRIQLEMMSGLFHLYVGGHMASPFSPYDPLYLSHWAFMDYIWSEWQKRNPKGVSRFPATERYVKMMPFMVTPDDVLSSEQQACVIYISPTIGSACNSTDLMKWPRTLRDTNGFDRHGFDEDGYDVNGFNVKGRDRAGRIDRRNIYDSNGYDVQGYSQSGFDTSGWDKYNFNEYDFNRDGFDVEGYDESGYDRYGFDRDGRTPYGMYSNLSFAQGFDAGYAASLFDKYGYNKYGYDKNGLDRKGFDTFGFNKDGLDEDYCDNYVDGPYYMRYFYHAKQQLSSLTSEMLHDIKRICSPITPLPDYWFSNIWLGKAEKARELERKWNLDRNLDRTWSPRSSSVTPELLWLPITPDQQFCVNLQWYSGCPIGTKLFDCPEDKCAESSCASQPDAQCRMKNCGACYPEFYNGETGEVYQCYGCLSMSGDMHNEGSTWREGCNTCVCQAGLISCSPTPCSTHSCTHPAPDRNGCCEVCDGCEYNNRVYNNRERFQPNACEMCVCVDGSVMCHTNDRNCPHVDCDNPITLPGECCPTCSRDCRGRGDLQSWAMDKCTNCSCIAGRISCTKNPCPVLRCRHPRVSAGKCCPECMGCEYQGKKYRHLQNFMENSCSQCSCRFGTVSCTTQECPPLRCKYKERPPGSCCPRCRRGCEYEGAFHDNDESFTSTSDPCLECSCQNGRAVCQRMRCPRVSCSRPVVLEGECCPRCLSCRRGNSIYNEGQTWTSADKCKTCVCKKGVSSCRNIIPCRDRCTYGLIRPGHCCPDCSQCSYHGKVFRHQQTFTDPYDVCKTCSCQLGEITCSNLRCPEVQCTNVEIPTGECCQRCKSCVYEGNVKEHGSSWRIPQDPCTTCTCREGSIDCEDDRCSTAQCNNPSTPEGSCCPSCDGCFYRGRNYRNGDRVQSSDTCTTCLCESGNVNCRRKSCPTLKCQNPTKKQGDCCYSCEGCVYDGQSYEDGTVFLAPRSPCLNCTCEGGRVNCDRLDLTCERSFTCSHPGRTRTQCCPSCESCEYERRSYRNGETFYPDPRNRCTKCRCSLGTVNCETENCTGVSCRYPTRISGECCPVCEECQYRGKTYSNGEQWRSNSCTDCTCSAGHVQCRPVTCPLLACSHPAKAPGTCCPECTNCLYEGKVYIDGREFPDTSDACSVCTCKAGTIACIKRRCPALECNSRQVVPGECCPTCLTDCNYLGRSIPNGGMIQHPTESCKQCSCSAGRVNCTKRTCPSRVGCTHPSNGECCRDQCSDCFYGGKLVGNGNMVQSRDPCRKCTCTNGSMVCMRERCRRTRKCDNPTIVPGKCCPECPRAPRNCRHGGVRIKHGMQMTIRCQVCQCSNGHVSCTAVKCPVISCDSPVTNGCCRSCDHGCAINGTTYGDGDQVTRGQSECDICHCQRGSLVCTKRTCKTPICQNPTSDGCCQVCEGCSYKGSSLEDGITFPDPDNKCGECTCNKGDVVCSLKQCDVSCTHPLHVEGECCPRCGGDCSYNNTVYRDAGGLFTHPDDIHACKLCECNAGSIICQQKPCARTNCRNPVVNECGCSDCTGGCFYEGEYRRNKEKFPSPDKNKCRRCYCQNGDVSCGVEPCAPSACTDPSIDDCGCPTCDSCKYLERTYDNGASFSSPEDSCDTCVCEDGNVQCRSRTCPAVTCPHPGIDSCGCRACESCRFGGVDHETDDRFEDPDNKCNECICKAGVVTCNKVQCPTLPCSDPILNYGECCPICVGMCKHLGKSYADGSTFSIESDPCSTCSCSSGTVRCSRRRCLPICTSPVQQTGCCPDCSACLYQGIRREEGEEFSPRDNACMQCACVRGNVLCKRQECPTAECDNPRISPGKCCPTCTEPHTLECVINGRRQVPGATWITEIAGTCQECTCLESGAISCAKAECDIQCSHPVPQVGKCCAMCDGCYYQNHTYRNGMTFHLDACQSCSCSNGNVQCTTKTCQPLSCSVDKQVMAPGDCCPRCKSCIMAGVIYADHQRWPSPADPCQECHCLNGVVTCAQVQCAPPCQRTIRIPGQCCPVCAGCYYRMKVFQIGESFAPNSMDPCKICECQASPSGAPVMCCKRMECPSLADCPRSCIRQPRPGQCCPTCDNRPECGYGYCSERSLGSRVLPNENRCFQCNCMVESTWLCMRDNCRSLSCLPSQRYTPQGSCCPVCDQCHLDIENIDVPHGKIWKKSDCETCTCDRGSIKCVQQQCTQSLQCENGAVPYKKPGECCSECLNVNAPCTYEGKTVNANHRWNSDPCTTCTCFAGKVDCVTQKCRMPSCRSDEAPTVMAGECCARCVSRPASCVAFGDPHYKTFDGRFVHFQGGCHYLLTKDCSQSDFKVVVENMKIDGKADVTWTKEVSITTMGGKLTMKRDYSVVMGNGTVLQEYPVNLGPYYHIDLVGSYLIIRTNLGVQVTWNGRQQRVEVTVPGTYRRKTCGLCGNFNDYPQDDLRLRNSRITSSDAEFGNHWKESVPDSPPCDAGRDLNPCDGTNYAMRTYANSKCEVLRSSTFAACHTLVSPDIYYQTCVYDVCQCGRNDQACVCDVLEAYAAQCRRSGVIVRWRSQTLCNVICSYQRGYVFDECGSPCKRTCANRNLPPDSIAEQCYMPCVSGCQCPAGKVEHNGECIYPEHCPPEISSVVQNPVGGRMSRMRPMQRPMSPMRTSRRSRIVQPRLIAPQRLPLRHL